MNREYLFLAGEYQATMPAVFSNNKWQHTMTSKRLLFEDFKLHRQGIRENIKGLIIHASVDDHQMSCDNIQTIIDNKIPCWPNPYILQHLSNRHEVMVLCYCVGICDRPVFVLTHEEVMKMNGKLHYEKWDLDLNENAVVVKIGQLHCGEDKFLIQPGEPLPTWDGQATIEPFFEGESVRVLLIGDRAFGIKVTNDDSWIKNAAGANVEEWQMSDEILANAKAAADICGLEIAGVDYIVNEKRFVFLEINQFPGLGFPDEATKCAVEFFKQKMDLVQSGT